MQSLKNAAQRIGELLGLAYYTRPQTYSVKYSVEVKNHDSKRTETFLILPVPLGAKSYLFQHLSLLNLTLNQLKEQL